MKSDQFDWDTETSEVFQLASKQWCVRTANRFIRDIPREVQRLPVSSVAQVICFIQIDTEHALSDSIDLSKPCILTPLNGTHFMIDGWHRVYRAVRDGLEELRCVVLTEEENAECVLEGGLYIAEE